MLKTWSLVGKYALICSFMAHALWNQEPLYFADASTKAAVLDKIITFIQSNFVRVVLKAFLFLISTFFKLKGCD